MGGGEKVPPPITPPPRLPIYNPCGSPPILKLPLFQVIGHDALLHNVAWVTGDPKHLRAQPTGPEVDRWGGESGVGCEIAREDCIRAPPEEEERPKEDGCRKAMVKARDTMRVELLFQSV